MNAAVRGVVQAQVLSVALKFTSIYDGYQGLVENRIREAWPFKRIVWSTTWWYFLRFAFSWIQRRCCSWKASRTLKSTVSKHLLLSVVTVLTWVLEADWNGYPCIGPSRAQLITISRSTDYTIGYLTALNTVIDSIRPSTWHVFFSPTYFYCWNHGPSLWKVTLLPVA